MRQLVSYIKHDERGGGDFSPMRELFELIASDLKYLMKLNRKSLILRVNVPRFSFTNKFSLLKCQSRDPRPQPGIRDVTD